MLPSLLGKLAHLPPRGYAECQEGEGREGSSSPSPGPSAPRPGRGRLVKVTCPSWDSSSDEQPRGEGLDGDGDQGQAAGPQGLRARAEGRKGGLASSSQAGCQQGRRRGPEGSGGRDGGVDAARVGRQQSRMTRRVNCGGRLTFSPLLTTPSSSQKNPQIHLEERQRSRKAHGGALWPSPVKTPSPFISVHSLVTRVPSARLCEQTWDTPIHVFWLLIHMSRCERCLRGEGLGAIQAYEEFNKKSRSL